MGGHDTLRRYWKAWQLRWRIVARIVGLEGHCARTVWQRLAERFGTMAKAQCELVRRYGHALLKRYVIHTLPN